MHNDDLSLAPKNESSLTSKGELKLTTKNESSIYLMSCQSETLPRDKFVVDFDVGWDLSPTSWEPLLSHILTLIHDIS